MRTFGSIETRVFKMEDLYKHIKYLKKMADDHTLQGTINMRTGDITLTSDISTLDWIQQRLVENPQARIINGVYYDK